ncbi:hypothetical protein [Streptomyces sp. A1136]|uniref:hypothetical protein n=1 Tax=Streptomyces sp. A1136 TaxID=2563102 RepID=UPI0014473FCC|nr:hypothetical protein [Streptomyces sp. A1136]
MRAIVVRTLFAVVLSTGIVWGGAAAATADVHGTTITPPGGGHDNKHCLVTTAWGDSWCPRKPLD